MSRTWSFLVVGFLAGLLAASALFSLLARRPSDSAGLVTNLRVAHVLPTSHPVHRGLEFMARRAHELSAGKLKLTIFPGEQLGTEVQALEQLQAGTLAITKVSAGAVGTFVSVYKVLALPYLFHDAAHCWRVLDGDLGKELLTLLGTNDEGSSTGLRGLCFYDAGSRNFYSKEPVVAPADLRGKKFRVMNDPVAMDMVLALGGAPTPIPWGELYTALQQGVVDGAENNPPSLLSSRHYEVCKHFTLNHHTRIPDVLAISAKVWATLSSQEQTWIQQAAQESSAFQRQLWEEESTRALEELKKAGVQIHSPDLEPFRTATRPMLEKYSQGQLSTLVRRIQGARQAP